MLSRLLRSQWLKLPPEVVANYRGRSIPLLRRALRAKLKRGIPPAVFFECGLQDWPESEIPSYMRSGEVAALLRRVNPRPHWRLSDDKIATTERFVEHDVPAGPILFVVGAERRSRIFPTATTRDEAAELLRAAPDRLFIKPAGGERGENVMAPTRSGEGWRTGEDLLSTEQLAARLIDQAPSWGWVVQPMLRTHADLAPIGGALGLSTARVIVALTDTGGEILCAYLKVMGREALTDIFAGGATGNLVAAVDHRTGVITRVLGRRKGARHLLEPVALHPATGRPMVGYQLPLWDRVREAAVKAAEACPELPLVGLDIAITDDGPMIMESNICWASDTPQLTMARGLRPMLRELLPRLAVPSGSKAEIARLVA